MQFNLTVILHEHFITFSPVWGGEDAATVPKLSGTLQADTKVASNYTIPLHEKSMCIDSLW